MIDLSGTSTALVTPFTNQKDIDFDRFSQLIETNITNGINHLVILGTTGETPTITDDEYSSILKHAVTTSNGRATVIAGATTNATEKAGALFNVCKDAGVDALLSAGPFYNKPTQEGYFQHFSKLADHASNLELPIILYNVPGRTAGNIEPETIIKLSAHPNIIGVKEASGNLSQVEKILLETNINSTSISPFYVLSGDDSLTLPMMALGAHGVISVVSNAAPKQMSELVTYALQGNFNNARALHYKLLPLMTACFIESNPIPIKCALYELGQISLEYRLPLTPPQPKTIKALQTALSIVYKDFIPKT